MTDKDYDRLKQIEVAIQAFNSKKLYESSLALYKALDYTSNKTERISPATFDSFIDSFNLSKNAINKDKALVSHWKQIEFIFQVADSEITRVQSLFDTGEVDRNEYQSFLFFTIQLKEESYKRSELVKITRELNVPFKMPVIVLFHYGNKLTLSIIDRRLHKKDTSKDVLEKVTLIKDIDIANPQRAHKEILKDLSLNELYKKFEFHSFVKLHEAWKATLNISELNKKFYKELAYWYFWALQEVEFPDDELKDDKTRNPVNVIRLITRLIFVWFLKEKNLIPDDLFNKRELDKILDYKDKTGSTYYKAILQNLFFATLNTEMNKDVKDKNKISRTFVNRNTGVPHYFRYSRFIKDQDKFTKWMNNIPFLNGGLFECLDKRTKDKSIYIDGFSQQVKNELLVTVPDYLFFSDAPRNIDLNNTFHTKGKKYEVRGLIDILSRYKFTIEENTPVEEEVALDPELLGKVFENLLASYNEETETTARKLTGSFYSPREIVNYMVDESLITYLCNSLLKEDDEKKREELNTRLHHLFSYTAEEPQFTDAEKKDLIDAIDTCKILDPACGSGAFPMGILHKLVFILGKLDPNNKRWKQKQLDKVVKDRKTAENELRDDKVREATILEIDKRENDIKKAFNQNNHELDFARKLYLIENCIYGVDKQPVAIQISKLRFFIALIVDQKTENDNEPNRGIRPLPNLETKFVAADTLVSIDKPVEGSQLSFDNLALKDAIKKKEDEIHEVRERHFRARTPETKEKRRLEDAKLRDELAALLEQDGFPKAATRQLAGWNPYDQNTFADFFDPMWMFEIEKGFDIVIGNPPWGAKLSDSEKKYLGIKYPIVPTKIKDSYLFFLMKSIDLLKPNGTLSLIIPNTWLLVNNADKFRQHILSYKILEIDDYGDGVFEQATVESSNIFLVKQKDIKQPVRVKRFDKLELKSNSVINKSLWLNDNLVRILLDFNSDKRELFDKIEKYTEHFSDNNFIIWGIKPYQVGYGRPPQTQEDVTNRIYHSPKSKGKNWHPILIGSNINRFSISYENLEYIKYGEWLMYTSNFDVMTSDKILVRQTSDIIRAAFDDSKNLAQNSLFIVYSRKYNLKFLTALLNSPILNFIYKTKNPQKGKVFAEIKPSVIKELPIPKSNQKTQDIVALIVQFLIETRKSNEDDYLENLINGIVYELYFGEEMKKAGVDILALVEKDLEAVKKLTPEKAISKLYEKWKEPKNEVRNRLLLMSTRCPDTIGVIEASVS